MDQKGISIVVAATKKILVAVCHKNMQEKGFTLFETLIYISILIVLLTVFLNFIWEISYGNIKIAEIEEVQQNGRIAMENITRAIQGSLSVNNPVVGVSDSILSLEVSDKKLNPVVFDVVSGVLRVSRENDGPYDITNSLVVVQNIQFTNISYPNTPDTVRIEMTISHKNQEDNVPLTLVSTVSLFKGGALVSE
jgi:competence protein ComGC